MGDEERADLCRGRLLMQHQGQGVGGFITTHALAGVLTAAHLLEVRLESRRAGA